MKPLEQFLLRNSVDVQPVLPLVHSTRAFHLREFQRSNKLLASPCDVFVGEKLNYFFVGRPAYKFSDEGGEGAYWEFPCCFVFDFSSVGGIQRVFPFDSGAFSRRLYPGYISMMDLDSFDASNVQNAAGRIIGAFFGSPAQYFKLEAKSEREFVREYSLNVMDAELKALHRLSTEWAAVDFDDRRFAIEVQSQVDVDLTVSKPLALIAPSEYFEDAEFRKHVVEIWGAEPIPYPIYSLSVTNSYGQIYERVRQLYANRGFF